MQRFFSVFFTCIFTLVIASCGGTYLNQRKENGGEPALLAKQAIMGDGYVLPLRRNMPGGGSPRAVVLALHGFNDYSNAFSTVGESLAREQVLLISYDQRGFGQTKGRGYWHGNGQLKDDLLTMVKLLKQRYEGVPLYLLGESMGGAVILAALEELKGEGGYDGIILVAPAVWGLETMVWYQRGGLWFFANFMPWFSMSGQGLDIRPSDNIKMLRALGRDPLILTESRADTVYGLSTLMDEALKKSTHLSDPALILYGKKDQIIPAEPTCTMLGQLPRQEKKWHFILYKNGYHMLTRDLQAQRVHNDITDWLNARISGVMISENTLQGMADYDRLCGGLE